MRLAANPMAKLTKMLVEEHKNGNCPKLPGLKILIDKIKIVVAKEDTNIELAALLSEPRKHRQVAITSPHQSSAMAAH